MVKDTEGKDISLEEADLRLQKQILRWVNQDSYDGYTDQAAISILGMKGSDKEIGISWDYRDYKNRFPKEYADNYRNQEYFPKDGRSSDFWQLGWLKCQI